MAFVLNTAHSPGTTPGSVIRHTVLNRPPGSLRQPRHRKNVLTMIYEHTDKYKPRLLILLNEPERVNIKPLFHLCGHYCQL